MYISNSMSTNYTPRDTAQMYVGERAAACYYFRTCCFPASKQSESVSAAAAEEPPCAASEEDGADKDEALVDGVAAAEAAEDEGSCLYAE